MEEAGAEEQGLARLKGHPVQQQGDRHSGVVGKLDFEIDDQSPRRRPLVRPPPLPGCPLPRGLSQPQSPFRALGPFRHWRRATGSGYLAVELGRRGSVAAEQPGRQVPESV